MSRSQFLRFAFARAARRAGDAVEAVGRALPAAPRAVSASPPPVTSALDARWRPPRPSDAFVRPPGARPEAEFLKRCTQCDDCIKGCPHWVIRKAGVELGASIAGTPILLPHENPCLYCKELPCIRACTTGALQLPPAGVARPRIGVAVVASATCYMTQGQPCDYCMKSCPERPRAIIVGARGTPAVVNAETCTGCGQCAQICPARAIRIEDRRESERAGAAVQPTTA